ncbi:MAG: ribosomal-processing cysteine protease Prp [Saccharofermentans sp.]|jgi:uncharacterized protein YsxB (DUF464 family)|nr:ribosomal-processing cysteine protease Prp [Mageeibacillus sp.]MCI1263847.1 ribosomal-processing cysteine protease Prp [Saccharofermentans sp.]MCI1275349.1 ribosomal-processing cysteine protease Prp [Saccharofermentans sp.]MCI1769727.1 ribosomal-processing cysteine protease Prp [Mageeibacillus sp.]MCI2043803.1 ribosomal-processing cysteine protease Prp [Mageeibacillus sp.]
MITVIVERDVARNIRCVYMSGHSGYSEPGTDIICAAASVLCYTAANALEDICGYDNEDFFRVSGEGTEDVNVRIEVPDKGTEEARQRAQVIMRTAELGFMSISKDYNDKKNRYLEIINSTTPEV